MIKLEAKFINENEAILVYGNARVGDMVREVDGFFVFYPPYEAGGGFSSHHLKQIADLLDTVNFPYEEQINEYFDKQEKEGG